MRNNLVKFSKTITNILFPHKLPHFSQRKRFMKALKRGSPIFLYSDPFCNLSPQEVSHSWLVDSFRVGSLLNEADPARNRAATKKDVWISNNVLICLHHHPRFSTPLSQLCVPLGRGTRSFLDRMEEGRARRQGKRWNVTQFAAWWLQSSSAQCANRVDNGLFVDQHTYWLLWC